MSFILIFFLRLVLAKGKSFLSGGWVKKILLAFGVIGAAGMVGQITGINNQFVSPVLGYLIGGLPVAILALLLPSLAGGSGGLNLSGVMGRAVPANPNVSTAGTVYT